MAARQNRQAGDYAPETAYLVAEAKPWIEGNSDGQTQAPHWKIVATIEGFCDSTTLSAKSLRRN